MEFEDILAALESLVAAGIPIFKLQEARRCGARGQRETVRALEQFTDTIYLSQTTERRDGQLHLVPHPGRRDRGVERSPGWHAGVADTLPRARVPRRDRWVRTTRSSIEAALELHRRTPLSDHLEIETYTWDVLPEHLKTGDIDEYVSREIDWVPPPSGCATRSAHTENEGSADVWTSSR